MLRLSQLAGPSNLLRAQGPEGKAALGRSRQNAAHRASIDRINGERHRELERLRAELAYTRSVLTAAPTCYRGFASAHVIEQVATGPKNSSLPACPRSALEAAQLKEQALVARRVLLEREVWIFCQEFSGISNFLKLITVSA
jgi:hypothetical protein